MPISAIDKMIPSLDRIGTSEWLDFRTEEVLDLAEVVAKYGDAIPLSLSLSEPATPWWLKNIRNSIPVGFIGTERLTHPSGQ